LENKFLGGREFQLKNVFYGIFIEEITKDKFAPSTYWKVLLPLLVKL
jgi:hypothetical protein